MKDIAAALEELTDRIRRIKPPMSSKPDAFHEDKSEVVALSRQVAEWVRTGRKPVELEGYTRGR